jgi:hypothetical protein
MYKRVYFGEYNKFLDEVQQNGEEIQNDCHKIFKIQSIINANDLKIWILVAH